MLIDIAKGPFYDGIMNDLGVSCGCADVFGGTEEAEKSGFDLIKDNPVPGTPGMSSLRKLAAEGSTILTF